jgi:hypothetical protein
MSEKQAFNNSLQRTRGKIWNELVGLGPLESAGNIFENPESRLPVQIRRQICR